MAQVHQDEVEEEGDGDDEKAPFIDEGHEQEQPRNTSRWSTGFWFLLLVAASFTMSVGNKAIML